MFHYRRSDSRFYVSAPTVESDPAVEGMDFTAFPQPSPPIPSPTPPQSFDPSSTSAEANLLFSVDDAVVAVNAVHVSEPIPASDSFDASIPNWLVPFLGHSNPEGLAWGNSNITSDIFEQPVQYFQFQESETSFASLADSNQFLWTSDPLFPDTLMATEGTIPNSYFVANEFTSPDDDQRDLQFLR